VKDIYLSVVIPAYDEMANLQKGVLEKVNTFLDKCKFTSEVIVVDDGSKDGSVEFIRKFSKEFPRFKVIQNPHTGKGGAVTTGVLASTGKIVLFTDMDQATPIEEINKLLPFFEKYDIVIGSRNTKRKGSPLSRQIISRGFMLLRTAIVGLPGISDTQCGFKAFKKDAAQKIFQKIYDMHGGFKKISGSAVTAGFDIELLFIAERLGYKIKEVPVTWLYVETRRVSPIKDSIDGVRDLVKIRQNAIAGKYGDNNE
jgi:dolichyl-phosphate beta-glucosyltransferase